MEINILAGILGDVNGITQFASPSTLLASNQNGWANGDLATISIGEDGTITGLFTNSVTRTLAQVFLAKFPNASGLNKVGDNLYMVTGNSGNPLTGTAEGVINSTIQSGSLEMSNVDLAQEFTNMIITQRGFQANARIISTSDEMLTELVNLKR
jgi:flagellar hook protein FlgE